jgi:hypothetical protein
MVNLAKIACTSLLVGAVIAGVAMFALPAQPPGGNEWTRIESTDARFTALFPVATEFDSRETKMSSLPLKEWCCWLNGSRFAVTVLSLKRNRELSDEQIHEMTASNTANLFGGTVKNNSRIMLNGREGRSQKIVTNAGTIEQHVFIDGDVAYFAQVTYPEEAFDRSYVRYFVENFSLH